MGQSSIPARDRGRFAGIAAAVLLAQWSFVLHAGSCGGASACVQVLGSGGPAPDIGRASSGYLLWLDGRARVLIDSGGGTFLRFSESGARLADLWFVGLSHLHADHSADFPALLKGAYFSGREASLPLAAPSGGSHFPGLGAFLQGLFDQDEGAYRYLSGYLTGEERFELVPLEIDHGRRESAVVWSGHGTTIASMGVPHGIVPALAFRLEFAGRSVVFGGDQNGSASEFTEFARNADLLVMHMAIPEHSARAARTLHATPSQIGRIAEASGARTLLLSHFMARSLAALEDSLGLVKKHYSGSVILAEDLMAIDLGRPVRSESPISR